MGNQFIDVNETIIDFCFEWDDILPTRDEFVQFLRQQPTMDVVEVVRCRDCRHMELTPIGLRMCDVWGHVNGMGDEGFCNYGERNDG